MKRENQKLKLFYLLKILSDYTDDGEGLTLAEIREKLKYYGIEAERKSLYRDMDTLGEVGYFVEKSRDGYITRYWLSGRKFESAELKLLVDAVHSAKFITEKKTTELINKISSLSSINVAKQLRREVANPDKVKAENEAIYYNVDTLNTAITECRKIRFKYFEWNSEKRKIYRHDGAVYETSPWGLLWSDDKYYLIAYDKESGEPRHYRVDKMEKIEITDKIREGDKDKKGVFSNFSITEYSAKLFGMFGGKEDIVSLTVDNSLAGVIIDRFGTEPEFFKKDEKHFTVNVKVRISPQFYAWVFSFGGKIMLDGPAYAVDEYKKLINNAKCE